MNNNDSSEKQRVVGLLDTIGNTPMVELKKLNKNPFAKVFVKMEFLNPSGSIKDRIVKHMINRYEEEGKLKKGTTIVENSSGNTAAAVAMISALKGYPAILVVPHKCSIEKQNALKAFGARVIVTPKGAKPGTPEHYESVAKRLEENIPNSIRLNQYNNPLNIDAHYSTTGPEIYEQTNGEIDVFVCGGSTGGTISGIGRYLKEQDENIKVYLVDPPGSALYNAVYNKEWIPSEGKTTVEGIGKNYFCKCHDVDVIDEAIQITDKQALLTARQMAMEEGILCGGSSGANVWAALELAKQATEPTTIVTVLPDGGQKYLSKYFNPNWLCENSIIDEEEKFLLLQSETVDELND
eukprot:TRINITY_DN13789_c0_g1_i1.p1 TRINITY_DN13789_c0_g1~~TRINITY_DN13789_c0_g1_i1.p1  ORF type:complete len:379 (-),score=141.97 TRINITY_DN13789_c0_g1_i1:168-1223(-)